MAARAAWRPRGSTRVRGALLVGALCNCASAPRAVTPSRCTTVEGAPTQSQARAGETPLHGMTLRLVAVSPPPGERAFDVTVVGPSMRRTLGAGVTCESRPPPDHPCDAVSPDAFAHDLGLRLVDAGLRAEDIHVDYLAVHRWSDLDGAVAAVADALRAGRIASAYRVVLQPYTCVVLLKGGA